MQQIVSHSFPAGLHTDDWLSQLQCLWACNVKQTGRVMQMDKNARKVRNQDINPCIEESDASQKCLDAYNYDKSKCSAYFQRYKNCRKYWHNIMLERRREGVKPDMPTAAERQERLTALGGKPY